MGIRIIEEMCLTSKNKALLAVLGILHIAGLIVSSIYLGISLHHSLEIISVIKIAATIVFNIVGIIAITTLICSQEDVFQSFESGATPTTQRGMRILNGLFGITMVLFSIIGLGFAVEALVLVSFKYSDGNDSLSDAARDFSLSSMFVLNFCLTTGIWSYFTSVFAGYLFSTGIIEGEVVEEGDNTSGIQNRAHLSDESSNSEEE